MNLDGWWKISFQNVRSIQQGKLWINESVNIDSKSFWKDEISKVQPNFWKKVTPVLYKARI